MQRSNSALVGQALYSVHTAGKIGLIRKLILRQQDLKVELLEIVAFDPTSVRYLLPSDIRFDDGKKIIIDSHESLSEPNELLRHQEILNHPFSLLGCRVVTQSGKRLGKVKDFSVDMQHFVVSKLNVVAPIWMLPFNSKFLIDRSDIVDIEKSKIVVKDAAVKTPEPVTKPLPATK